MTQPDGYDFRRARTLLDDLDESLRGHAPTLKLEPPAGSVGGIRGVANRTGLLRLGIALASTALVAEAVVSVREDGTVYGDAQVGLLEIVLVDDPPEQRPPPPRDVSSLGCAVLVILGAVMVALMMIGLMTILGWLGAGAGS